MFDKRQSLDFIQECIEAIDNATDLEKETMRQIYFQEKKHFEQNDFEVILPCELEQGKMLEMDYEPINVVLDLKKDASSFYNNDSMNSVVFDELEGFAA